VIPLFPPTVVPVTVMDEQLTGVAVPTFVVTEHCQRVGPLEAGNCAVCITRRELGLPLGVEDIGVHRELRSELRRYGLRIGPVLALFVNAD
jgi:hypothetical protein